MSVRRRPPVAVPCLVIVLAIAAMAAAQDPPAPPPPPADPAPPVPAAGTGSGAPQEAPETGPARRPRRGPPGESEGEGPGRRRVGRGGEGEGGRGDAAGGTGAEGAAAEKKEPRKGIPVQDELVHKLCASCHKPVEGGEKDLLGRISFMRKAPEGWEMSLKRMVRQHDLKIPPEDARRIVASLSNSHGLTRDEARRALYEAERRIHWSEAEHDQDLKQTCTPCHTLGRVLAEQRDETEWKLLKATHLAFFPLADWQAFRGRESFGGGGPGGGGAGGGGEAAAGGGAGSGGGRGGAGGSGSGSGSGRAEGERSFEDMSEAEMEAEMERRRERARGPDRADKVLGELAKKLPLFTKEWEEWQVQKREVLLDDAWTVAGHEIGRGEVRGTVAVRRTGPDAFETTWDIAYGDGARVRRSGKAVLYGGYSWRGRSEPAADAPAGEPKSAREVLLLSEDWQRLEGRVFHGDHAELGMDVTLHRQDGATRILAVDGGALLVPSTGNKVDVFGHGFPEAMRREDWFLGAGANVAAVERVSAGHARLVVDVAPGADQGARQIGFRAVQGPKSLVLHDTIDYIKIFPEEGFARVGGERILRQVERFEAFAMNRGKDDKPWTADDFKVKVVPAQWKLEEFPVRENDDDVAYVGAIDPVTALLTPNRDGPNPKRHFSANNIGDVYVVATCTLTVPKIPPKPKKKDAAPAVPAAGGGGGGAAAGGGGAGAENGGGEAAPVPAAVTGSGAEKTVALTEKSSGTLNSRAAAVQEAPATAPVLETKEFRARGHLLVTVPVYVQWDRYEWDRQ